MTAVQADPLASILGILVDAADEFAVRAQAQQFYRDQARPGTSAHHVHAHSVTLWRQAESSLRARIAELQVNSE